MEHFFSIKNRLYLEMALHGQHSSIFCSGIVSKQGRLGPYIFYMLSYNTRCADFLMSLSHIFEAFVTLSYSYVFPNFTPFCVFGHLDGSFYTLFINFLFYDFLVAFRMYSAQIL